MKKRAQLTADSPMPFGEFKGTKMGALPIEYVDFLLRQTWLRDWPHVQVYIESRRAEVEAKRASIPTPKTLTTFEQYTRWGRR